MKIALYIKELTLGYLEYNNNYYFTADESNIQVAFKKYPIDMMLFSLNKAQTKEYKYVPQNFLQYLEATAREDLRLKADIKDEDSEFVKLYKLAGLKICPENFGIRQA